MIHLRSADCLWDFIHLCLHHKMKILQIMNIKINNQKFLVLLAALLVGMTACKKPSETTDVDQLIDSSVAINNNFDELNMRVSYPHQPVMFTNTLKNSDIARCGDYTWYLVAEVDAPLVDGEPLSATDVRVLGNRAYVSYHRQGDVHAGAVEVIDITDPGFPVLRSHMDFAGVDVNTLAVDNHGTDAERRIFLAASSNKKGALLRQVIANDGYLSAGIVDITLSKALSGGDISASANGIAISDDYIYISSGNSFGGTYQIDRSNLTFVSNEEYTDAKAVALNGTSRGSYQVSLIGGDNGKLNVYRVGEDRTLVRSIDLGAIVHQNVDEPYLGKATVTMLQGENIAYVAMNAAGMKAVNVETGQVVYTSSPDMLTTGNTHGLTVDNGNIYMANSDDGLYIGCLPDGGGVVNDVQFWDLDETGASANMVQADGDWVFVAKGGGGLKILRKVANSIYPNVKNYDENGCPTPMDGNDELCESLISDFQIALPEGKDATKKNKEFFTNENREVVLTERAEVAVSFVLEGAGYRNTFGYYAYNKNNPPQTVEDILDSKHIIFANTSAVGSGGTLKEGDRVNLGTFDAGTVIGYFIISDGWNGYEVTEGLYTIYTNPNLNRDGKQQSIMMYSENCGSLITAFEDIHTSGGDKDFNDLVVKTSISPLTAMNTDVVVSLPHKK